MVHDAEKEGFLLETLEVFLGSGRNFAVAAGKLNTHYQKLVHVLKSIESPTGTHSASNEGTIKARHVLEAGLRASGFASRED